MNQRNTLHYKVAFQAGLLLGSDSSLRKGQAMMNALRTIDPELHEAITGTEADCFYNDKNIQKFWEAL